MCRYASVLARLVGRAAVLPEVYNTQDSTLLIKALSTLRTGLPSATRVCERAAFCIAATDPHDVAPAVLIDLLNALAQLNALHLPVVRTALLRRLCHMPQHRGNVPVQSLQKAALVLIKLGRTPHGGGLVVPDHVLHLLHNARRSKKGDAPEDYGLCFAYLGLFPYTALAQRSVMNAGEQVHTETAQATAPSYPQDGERGAVRTLYACARAVLCAVPHAVLRPGTTSNTAATSMLARAQGNAAWQALHLYAVLPYLVRSVSTNASDPTPTRAVSKTPHAPSMCWSEVRRDFVGHVLTHTISLAKLVQFVYDFALDLAHDGEILAVILEACLSRDKAVAVDDANTPDCPSATRTAPSSHSAPRGVWQDRYDECVMLPAWTTYDVAKMAHALHRVLRVEAIQRALRDLPRGAPVTEAVATQWTTMEARGVERSVDDSTRSAARLDAVVWQLVRVCACRLGHRAAQTRCETMLSSSSMRGGVKDGNRVSSLPASAAAWTASHQCTTGSCPRLQHAGGTRSTTECQQGGGGGRTESTRYAADAASLGAMWQLLQLYASIRLHCYDDADDDGGGALDHDTVSQMAQMSQVHTRLVQQTLYWCNQIHSAPSPTARITCDTPWLANGVGYDDAEDAHSDGTDRSRVCGPTSCAPLDDGSMRWRRHRHDPLDTVSWILLSLARLSRCGFCDDSHQTVFAALVRCVRQRADHRAEEPICMRNRVQVSYALALWCTPSAREHRIVHCASRTDSSNIPIEPEVAKHSANAAKKMLPSSCVCHNGPSSTGDAAHRIAARLTHSAHYADTIAALLCAPVMAQPHELQKLAMADARMIFDTVTTMLMSSRVENTLVAGAGEPCATAPSTARSADKDAPPPVHSASSCAEAATMLCHGNGARRACVHRTDDNSKCLDDHSRLLEWCKDGTGTSVHVTSMRSDWSTERTAERLSTLASAAVMLAQSLPLWHTVMPHSSATPADTHDEAAMNGYGAAVEAMLSVIVCAKDGRRRDADAAATALRRCIRCCNAEPSRRCALRVPVHVALRVMQHMQQLVPVDARRLRSHVGCYKDSDESDKNNKDIAVAVPMATSLPAASFFPPCARLHPVKEPHTAQQQHCLPHALCTELVTFMCRHVDWLSWVSIEEEKSANTSKAQHVPARRHTSTQTETITTRRVCSGTTPEQVSAQLRCIMALGRAGVLVRFATSCHSSADGEEVTIRKSCSPSSVSPAAAAPRMQCSLTVHLDQLLSRHEQHRCSALQAATLLRIMGEQWTAHGALTVQPAEAQRLCQCALAAPSLESCSCSSHDTQLQTWMHTVQAYRHLHGAHRLFFTNEHSARLLCRFVELVRPMCARARERREDGVAWKGKQLVRMVRAMVNSRVVEQVMVMTTTSTSLSPSQSEMSELAVALREVYAVLCRRYDDGSQAPMQLVSSPNVDWDVDSEDGLQTTCAAWHAYTALTYALDNLFPPNEVYANAHRGK